MGFLCEITDFDRKPQLAGEENPSLVTAAVVIADDRSLRAAFHFREAQNLRFNDELLGACQRA